LFVMLNVIVKKSTEVKMQKEREEGLPSFKALLTKPEKADMDQSGVISVNEALLLGIALALDAFGAGIGAAFLGYSPLVTTLLTSSMSGFFVFSGLQIGLLLSKNEQLQKMTFIPPLLLIGLGLMNIFLQIPCN